jgi:putative acetyltransferase
VIAIRAEQPRDAAGVRQVNEQAFGQGAEANLVDLLRARCPEALSLVAHDGDRVVGHIMFTPVAVEHGARRTIGMGLAPMAVLPQHQRHGIGSQLVKRGLEILGDRRCPFVIVVGHPGYYPRFGFEPAGKHGLRCQWDSVPEEAFMTLILDPGAMAGVSGVAMYRPEFAQE